MSNFKNLIGNFTAVPNQIVNDARLSFKARGILLYLISKPDSWEFSEERISLRSTDGKASIKSGLKEIEKFGYLERKKIKSDNGKFIGIEYTVTLPDVRDENLTIVRKSDDGKTNDGKTVDGKPHNISNTNNSKKDISNTNKKNLVETSSTVENEFKELQKDFARIYFEFFEKRNGEKPKLGGGDYKALKELRIHILGSVKKANPNADEQKLKDITVEKWESLLNKIDTLKVNYLKNNISPRRINSNYNEIINDLKGNSNVGFVKKEQKTNKTVVNSKFF